MIFEFATRNLAGLCQAADLDFAVIDTEHAGISISDLADQMAWFRATDVAPFVRVSGADDPRISTIMDLGALGVMIPNVKNSQEVRQVVDAVMYAPLGSRGVIFGGPHSGFTDGSPTDFMEHSNQNTSIIIQIESPEGVRNIESIASTRGIDALWVGQFDLTNAMGIPGNFDDPEFLMAFQKVIRVAGDHDLTMIMQPGNTEQARRWIEMGVNAISYHGDHYLYLKALRNGVQAIRKIDPGN
jgi:2-keto-3-deoxy-L-rhamnonate aldolase RhmA